MAPTEAKIKILCSIFSGKVEFDGEFFRTEEFNRVLTLIYQTDSLLEENKKGEISNFSENSTLVPPSRIELLSKV